MDKTSEKHTHPWYREPIVWLAIAIPSSAVIYGFFYLTVSITSFDGMVVDDYYKVGKQINRELKRDKAAKAHGLTGELVMDKGGISVSLQTSTGYTPPPALEIKFIYSTRANMDRDTFLEQVQPGVYQGKVASLETGRWNVQIAADDWRLMGSLRSPDEDRIKVKPLALNPKASP
jgi:hypothetical protein